VLSLADWRAERSCLWSVFEWILAELRRSTRPGGAAQPLGVTTAERARKAVSARIRDAIHRIAEVMPDLGAHLDRSVRTGNTCCYDP
jgi:hypothetical protein